MKKSGLKFMLLVLLMGFSSLGYSQTEYDTEITVTYMLEERYVYQLDQAKGAFEYGEYIDEFGDKIKVYFGLEEALYKIQKKELKFGESEPKKIIVISNDTYKIQNERPKIQINQQKGAYRIVK